MDDGDYVSKHDTAGQTATDKQGYEYSHLLRLSHQAFSGWQEFVHAIVGKMRAGGELEHYSYWIGKATGAAARLAGVLYRIKHAHGRSWETAITRETMTDALKIMAVFTGVA